MSPGTPSSEGVDADSVQRFLDHAEDTGLDVHGLSVVRHSRVVAHGIWAPYQADRPRLVYSVSKNFTITAVGAAIGEGLLGLDDTVVSFYPELDGEIRDPRSRSMTVRHLAAMASGHLSDTIERARELDPLNWVRGFLLLPPEREPGTVFAYNQSATYTLAAIVQRVTGQSLMSYLRARILDPIGIGATAWTQGPPGQDLGYSGLFATTDAIARLGLLYLRDGFWGNRRLLPPGWAGEATRVYVSTARPPKATAADPDSQLGYGFQFWRSRHGYRGDGAYGQYCLVLPDQDAVIATTAGTERVEDLLDAVWRFLLPAFHDAPLTGRAKHDARLADRLENLELAPADGQAVPPTVGAESWHGADFAPLGGRCSAQPGLTSVRVTSEEGMWSVTLQGDGGPLRLRLGRRWTVQAGPGVRVPVAVSGGWRRLDTLVVHVIFLETPHQLVVTCAREAGTFTADWLTRPLDEPPLRSLRAPYPAGD